MTLTDAFCRKLFGTRMQSLFSVSLRIVLYFDSVADIWCQSMYFKISNKQLAPKTLNSFIHIGYNSFIPSTEMEIKHKNCVLHYCPITTDFSDIFGFLVRVLSRAFTLPFPFFFFLLSRGSQ